MPSLNSNHISAPTVNFIVLYTIQLNGISCLNDADIYIFESVVLSTLQSDISNVANVTVSSSFDECNNRNLQDLSILLTLAVTIEDAITDSSESLYSRISNSLSTNAGKIVDDLKNLSSTFRNLLSLVLIDSPSSVPTASSSSDNSNKPTMISSKLSTKYPSKHSTNLPSYDASEYLTFSLFADLTSWPSKVPKLATPIKQSSIMWTLVGIDLTIQDGSDFSIQKKRNELIALMNQLVREGADEFEVKMVTVIFESPYTSSHEYFMARKLKDTEGQNVIEKNYTESSLTPSLSPSRGGPSPSPTVVPTTIMTVIIEGRTPLEIDFKAAINEFFLISEDNVAEEIQTIIAGKAEVSVVMQFIDLDRPSASPSVTPTSSPTVSHAPTNKSSISRAVLSAVGGAAAAGAAAVSFSSDIVSFVFHDVILHC